MKRLTSKIDQLLATRLIIHEGVKMDCTGGDDYGMEYRMDINPPNLYFNLLISERKIDKNSTGVLIPPLLPSFNGYLMEWDKGRWVSTKRLSTLFEKFNIIPENYRRAEQLCVYMPRRRTLQTNNGYKLWRIDTGIEPGKQQDYQSIELVPKYGQGELWLFDYNEFLSKICKEKQYESIRIYTASERETKSVYYNDSDESWVITFERKEYPIISISISTYDHKPTLNLPHWRKGKFFNHWILTTEEQATPREVAHINGSDRAILRLETSAHTVIHSEGYDDLTLPPGDYLATYPLSCNSGLG